MAPIATELATLRALTFRISSTPTSQLPQHVPAIATALANCRNLLSSSQASGSKASSETSVAVHKYRTLLSTLLQDRTFQGRWSAIVLIKATIEAGGWETLQKSLPWVRGLLGMLSKPDPPTSKKLCLITLTRIFLLTREYPTLIREITTPSLSPFIQSSLQLANSKAPAALLQTIIECFNELIPRHPTVFRTYMKQLQQLLGQIIAPTPSSKLSPEQVESPNFQVAAEVSAAARRLYVQLHSCAPKGASSEEWEKSLKATVNSVHCVADKIFRAVVEDWQPSTRDTAPVSGQTLDDEVQDLQPDIASLTPWSGIYAGGERFIHLLRLIKTYLGNPTASVVNLNVAQIVDLVSRILSLTVPSSSSGKTLQNATRFNNQVSKEERENLWLILPSVHVATIELLIALVQRCKQTASLDSLLVDQLVWVFNSEKESTEVRTATYLAATYLLERSGFSLPKSSIDALGGIVRTCCDDILPPELSGLPSKSKANPTKLNGISQPQAATNADTFLNSSATKDPNAHFTGLKQAALGLLPVLLGNIQAQYLSDAIRARMDRTAVLAQHKDAMVASVLNPPPSKRFGKPAASILPLMARSFPGAKDVEGMLRPRMPVIRLGAQDAELDVDIEEEEVDEEEIIEEEKDDESDFVGQELDSLLESAGQAEEKRDLVMSDGPRVDDKARYEKISVPEHQASNEGTDGPNTDTIPSKIGEKRPQDDVTPLSPTKRVKFVEEETSMPNAPAATVTPSNPFTAATSSIPAATSQITATTTASVIPELPVPSDTKEGDSDDDEDIVPLVFGQDTDEESD